LGFFRVAPVHPDRRGGATPDPGGLTVNFGAVSDDRQQQWIRALFVKTAYRRL